MTTMRAAVLTAPKRFEVREVAMPIVGPDDAVRVARTGICGTDLHIFNGHYAADRLPLIPGHEFCGTVAERGTNVRHLTVGTRVVVDINIGCGSCFWCRRNEVLNCAEVTQVGIGRDGAFAEYVAVPARLAIPVDADIADAVLALTEPVACVVRAARKAKATFGQSVLIFGAGPIGNLHVQMMRLVGAAPIIVADLSPERCRMAVEAGRTRGIRSCRTEGRRSEDDGRTRRGSGDRKCRQSQTLPTGVRPNAPRWPRRLFRYHAAGDTVPLDSLRTVLEEGSLKGSVAGMGRICTTRSPSCRMTGSERRISRRQAIRWRPSRRLSKRLANGPST